MVPDKIHLPPLPIFLFSCGALVELGRRMNQIDDSDRAIQWFEEETKVEREKLVCTIIEG
jgi:hypothetical protein